METQAANVNPGGRVTSTADGGRHAPYVAELREFFASWQMRFGAPEDLAAFAQALREPGTFREELASLTRSVAYREQGTIAIAELLELMTVAMGGATIAEAGEAVREPVRELLRFLSKAMRGARAEALDNVAPDNVAPENVAAGNVTRATEPVEVAGMAAVAGVVDLAAEAGEPVSEFHPHAATEFYSRARSMSIGADDREFASERPAPQVMSEGDSAAETTVLERAAAPALRPAVSDHAKRRTSRLPSRMFAISAVAGVAVAAVLMMHPWARPAAGPVGEPTVSTVKPAEPAAGASSGSHSRIPAGQTDRAAGTASRAGVQSASGAMAVRPAASAPVARAKPAPSEPRPMAAASGTSGEATSKLPSVGSSSSKRVGVYTVSSGVMSANLISAPEPAYPKLARLIHLKGSVILQAVVSREGKVLTTHVLEGHRLLRGAASNAVRQWRYQPYLLNGQPEDVATIVTVNFRP